MHIAVIVMLAVLAAFAFVGFWGILDVRRQIRKAMEEEDNG